jgi:predicted Fe-S protein YdhL (DUF1289 family)
MPIETPCTSVYVVEPSHGWCGGCGRSLDEIARWTAMTDEERGFVMRQLPRRLRLIEAARVGAAGFA